jgi:hypothetical protein
MAIILPKVHSLEQHIQQLQSDPESYRPQQCPGCGHTSVWCHGYYHRHPGRHGKVCESLNPIPIPRFICARCQLSCSVLPECISPRRWYLWSIQQVMLMRLLPGALSVEQSLPHVRSIWRWWARLRERFKPHQFKFASLVLTLGQHDSATDFWHDCLSRWRLSSAMLFIQQSGEVIP